MDSNHLQKIQNLVKGAAILSADEKGEWLELLELMNERQLLELERILNSAEQTRIATPVAEPINRFATGQARINADKHPESRVGGISQIEKPKISPPTSPAKPPGEGELFSHIMNLPKAQAVAKPAPPAAPMPPAPKLESKTVQAKTDLPFLQKLKNIFLEKELPAGKVQEPSAPLDKIVFPYPSKPQAAVTPAPAIKLPAHPKPLPQVPKKHQEKIVIVPVEKVFPPVPPKAPSTVPTPKPVQLPQELRPEQQEIIKQAEMPQPAVRLTPFDRILEEAKRKARERAVAEAQKFETQVSQIEPEQVTQTPEAEQAQTSPKPQPVEQQPGPAPFKVLSPLSASKQIKELHRQQEKPGEDIRPGLNFPKLSGEEMFKGKVAGPEPKSAAVLVPKITLEEKPGDDIKMETLADVAALKTADFKQHAAGTLLRKMQKLIAQFGLHEVSFSLEKSPLYKAYVNTGTALLNSGGAQKTVAQTELAKQDFERFADLLIVMKSKG